jgi:hypothetical protein
LRTSNRVQTAAPAIIEDVIRIFMKPNRTNLAAGCAYWGPPKEVKRKSNKKILHQKYNNVFEP